MAAMRLSVLFLVVVGVTLLSKVAPCQTAPDTDAIFRAARDGDLDRLKELVGDGSVDVKSEDGATPLFDAAGEGHTEVVTWLLDKGAKIDAAMSNGTTPLIFAVSKDQVQTCRILIDPGASMNATIHDDDGLRYTPLAVALNHKNKELALLLIKAGANVNSPLGRGYVPDYPLEQAAWNRPATMNASPDVAPEGWEGQSEVIKTLLAKGAKSPWLSRIKEFDPLNLGPLTPETQDSGKVVVGSQPLVRGVFSAYRGGPPPPTPIKQALRGPDNKIGINFWRWGDPDKQKGPLTIALVIDKQGNSTKLQVVPTVYVGNDGIVYSQDVSETEPGGPFADLEVVAKKGISRVTAKRSNGQNVGLTREGMIFRARLSKVQIYETITVTTYGSDQKQLSAREIGCVYRAAKPGAVKYIVEE